MNASLVFANLCHFNSDLVQLGIEVKIYFLLKSNSLPRVMALIYFSSLMFDGTKISLRGGNDLFCKADYANAIRAIRAMKL